MDRANRWRFRVKGSNGEVIAQGQSYSRAFDCRKAAKRDYPGMPIKRV